MLKSGIDAFEVKWNIVFGYKFIDKPDYLIELAVVTSWFPLWGIPDKNGRRSLIEPVVLTPGKYVVAWDDGVPSLIRLPLDVIWC